MEGTFIYLNNNSYTKDGNYRCYATFVSKDGKVLTFNASAYQGNFPEPFSLCDVVFDMQQYGNNQTSFILKSFVVSGKLVVSKEGK